MFAIGFHHKLPMLKMNSAHSASTKIDFASRFPPRHLEASRSRGFEDCEVRSFEAYRYMIIFVDLLLCELELISFMANPKGGNRRL